MYRIIIITLLSFVFFSSYGQCERKSICKSSVGRFVIGDNKQEEMQLEATITIDKENIVINANIGGQATTITNKINSVDSCKWDEYLKTGKSIYRVSTNKGNNVLENSIIKITGTAGKLTIYFGSDPDEKGGLEFEIYQTKFED